MTATRRILQCCKNSAHHANFEVFFNIVCNLSLLFLIVVVLVKFDQSCSLRRIEELFQSISGYVVLNYLGICFLSCSGENLRNCIRSLSCSV